MSAAQQADVGKVAAAMRENGVCWKRIEDLLGLCARHLRRCMVRAEMFDRQKTRPDSAGRVG
jgi:hypothetical protein